METAEKTQYELFKDYEKLIADIQAVAPELAVEYIGDEQSEEYWYNVAIARDFEDAYPMLEVFDDQISYDDSEMQLYCQQADGNIGKLDQILMLTHNYVFSTEYEPEGIL